MKRTGGITATAVVALIGSACVALLAVIELFGILFASRLSPPSEGLPQQGPIPAVAAAVMGSLFNFGFAGWGLATGIGLLRLKPWSRISTLIYAGFLAFGSAMAALIFLFLPLPETANTGQNFNFVFRAVMELFCVVPFSIAVWWLAFFTRKSVAAQFSARPDRSMSPEAQAVVSPPALVTGPPRLQRPIILTIVAWFYLASTFTSAPWYFVGPFRKIPFPFFGTMLEGKAVMIYFAISIFLLLSAGIGLLKNRIWAYWLAIGFQLFGFLNVGASIFLPGRAARLERYVASFRMNFPMNFPGPPAGFFGMIMAVGLAGGMIVSAVVLWFLWTCRGSFFEFVASQARSEPTGE